MDFTQIKYQVDQGVALLTLHRPEQLNAFTHVMREELKEAFALADGDDQVRVVVVTGAGRAFCAGADLSGGGSTFDRQGLDGKPVELEHHRDGGGQVALAIYQCRKPVIAAINGPAVGVGLTITFAMDLRVAAADAKCGVVFVRRGVCPDACSAWFLPRLVGSGKACELFYTGRVFRAEDEADSGLFNYVVPTEQVLPRALEIAREIADNTSGMSVALAKGLIHKGLAAPDPETMHLIDSRVFLWAGRSADAREGIESFLEKRSPEFKVSPSRDLAGIYAWLYGKFPA